MVGDRRDPVRARLEHLDRARLGVGALALADHRPDAVAGDRALDEHDVAVDARDAGAAEGERVDRQLELVAALRASLRRCSARVHWHPGMAARARAPAGSSAPSARRSLADRLLERGDDRLAVGVLALVGQHLAQLGLRQLAEPALDLAAR